MKLVIVRGLPGSGKSTYAKSLGIFHVEQDMYFMQDGKYNYSKDELKNAVSWCKYTVENALKYGLDVVVSNTFTRKWELDYYINLSIKYRAKCQIVCMKNDFGNIHDIPKEVLTNMELRWETIEGEAML